MTEPPQTPGSGPDWDDMKGKVMAAKGSDRLILIAGVLFLVDSFLPWYGFNAGGFASLNIKGWNTGFLGVMSILSGLGALALSFVHVSGMKVSLPIKSGQLYMALGAGAFGFAVLRFITESRLTKYGLYIAIVLGAVLAYAGWMKQKAEA